MGPTDTPWRFLAGVALIGCVAAPGPTRAAPAAAPAPGEAAARALDRAQICRAALDYACAARELRAARADLEALPTARRRQALALSAEVALAQGRREAASRHLDALLALDPDFAPPEDAWPPAWRAELDAARRRAPDRTPPALTVHLPLAARAGEPVTVEVIARDPSGVAGVSVWQAPAEEARPTPGAPRGDGPPAPRPAVERKLVTTDGVTWRGTLAAGDVRGHALHLWVTAWDLRGNGPARWGSPDAPKTLPVTSRAATPGARTQDTAGRADVAQAPRALVERWWFWAAVGAGVVATAAGTYLLVRPDHGSPAGTADIDVELTWPSL